MNTEKEYTEEEIDALAKKIIRMIGFGFWILAMHIIVINIICRIADSSKTGHYECTDGVVIKAEEYKTYPFGGHGRANYNYEIKVEYVPKDEDRTHIFWDYSDAYENINIGDTIRIYYNKDDPDEAYAARKDWLTGRYLPAEKRYNIPLIISAVLFIIGIFFLINDKKIVEV